jgi:dimethylaniline monooxygenase (N-oxide forming)
MGFDKYLQNPSISLRILHVSQYRNPEDFKGKRVMVIGLSHSGSQIASELANTASSVISVFRSPRWIIEKNIKSDIYNKKLPWDVMLLSTKELREAFDKMKLDERHRARSGVLDQFSENNKIGGPFQKDNYSDSPFLFGVSDHYFGCVKKGSIKPVKSEIKTIEGNIVKLYNGEDYEIDELIICTGYDVDFSFLDQALLKSLNYDPKNKRNPVELDGNFVYNSNVKNLAFVGLMPYDVTIFTNEFQAGNQFSQEHRERKKKDERRT